MGTFATQDIPADITFEHCDYEGIYGPKCGFIGSKITHMGVTPLKDVRDIPKDSVFSPLNHCEYSCSMEIGNSYVFLAYDGHPAKFRISNLEYIRDKYDYVTGFIVTLEWVYQPNDRMDFLGP